MPTPYPKEFSRGVVSAAHQNAQSMAEVAATFGICASCPARRLRIADREDGNHPTPATAVDEGEVRDLRRRDNQLEHEVEILRRATACFGRDTLPT